MSEDRGFKTCTVCQKRKLIEDGRAMCDGCLNDKLTLELMQVDVALRERGWAGPSPIPLAPGVTANDEERVRFILRLGDGRTTSPAVRQFRLDPEMVKFEPPDES